MMSPRNIALAFSFAAHLTTAFQPRTLSPFIAPSVVRRSSSSSISMDSGLTLYGSQQTRSPLVNWYLEEKSIPFTQKAPRPSAHPFGQAPFLTDIGGVEVFESGAILLYIADAYGGKKLQTRPKLDSDSDSDCL
jgi:Glutathione S-transferase, N-terminal domain